MILISRQSHSPARARRGNLRRPGSARSEALRYTSVPLTVSQKGPVRAWSRIIYVPYIPCIIFVAREAKDATRCIYAQENDPGYRDDVTGRFNPVYGHRQPNMAASHYDALQHRAGASPDRCGVSTKLFTRSSEGTQKQEKDLTNYHIMQIKPTLQN